MPHNIRTAVQAIVDNALTTTGHTRTSPYVAEAVRLVEDGIVEQANITADILRRIGQEQSLPESTVENALIEAGLADAPEPEETPAEDLSNEERLARIENTLETLLTAARKYGLSV